MLALLPLLISLVPEVARLLAGDKAGTVAAQVVEVARTVVGTDDPAVAASVLADPAKLSDLRIRLAEISAQREAAAAQAHLDEIKAALGDTASARQQTVALSAQGSILAWGAPVVTMILLALFSVIILGGLQVDMDMRETVKTLTIAAATYWIGSSRGSAAKDERAAAAPPASPVTVASAENVNANPPTQPAQSSAPPPNPAPAVTIGQPSPSGTTADDLMDPSMQAVIRERIRVRAGSSAGTS